MFHTINRGLSRRHILPLTTSVLAASATSYAYYTEREANKEGKTDQVLNREYDRNEIASYWKKRPITVVTRVGSIAYELLPVAFDYVVDFKLSLDNDDEDTIEEKYRKHA